jgi:hypothetical protein
MYIYIYMYLFGVYTDVAITYIHNYIVYVLYIRCRWLVIDPILLLENVRFLDESQRNLPIAARWGLESIRRLHLSHAPCYELDACWWFLGDLDAGIHMAFYREFMFQNPDWGLIQFYGNNKGSLWGYSLT